MSTEGSIEGLERKPGESKEQIIQEIEAAIERVRLASEEQRQEVAVNELKNFSKTSFGLLVPEVDARMPEFRAWLRKEFKTNQ